MNIFDKLEKLINEHGSAAILRDQLNLAKAQHSALEENFRAIELKSTLLEAENAKLKEQLGFLQSQISGIQSGNPKGYVCDHCGSPKLERAGNRPDPTFGDLGIKQEVFRCVVCQKQSAFTP